MVMLGTVWVEKGDGVNRQRGAGWYSVFNTDPDCLKNITDIQVKVSHQDAIALTFSQSIELECLYYSSKTSVV